MDEPVSEVGLPLAQPIRLAYAAPPESLRQPAVMFLIGGLAATCGYFQLRNYDSYGRWLDLGRYSILVDPTASIALAIYAMVVAFVLFRNRLTARRHTLWLAGLTIAHEVFVYVTALRGYGFGWNEDATTLRNGFLMRMIFPTVLLTLANLSRVRRYDIAHRAAQLPIAR